MRKILLLLLLPVFSSSYGQGRARVDSLLNQLNHEYRNRQDTNKVKLLTQLAIQYKLTLNDSGEVYEEKALQLARQLGNKFSEAMCLYQIGADIYSYNEMGNLIKALTLFEEIDDKPHVAMTLDFIAGQYYNLERFSQALLYFERALSFYEKINDEYNTARIKGIIGETYGKLGNFTKALEYQLPVLPYFEKARRPDRTGLTLSNIGNAYMGLKDYNKALVYASSAVRLFTSLHKDSYLFGFALSDMGHIYFTAANDSTTGIHPDSLLATGRNENLSKAIYYYTAAHQVFKRNPTFVPTNIALRLSNALAATGRFEEALVYYREHAAYHESLLSENNRLKVSASETRREADLKDQQIVIKKRERWLFGIGLALLAIVVVLVWRSYN
ncbi:MAG: tetratricopeptide repeat protein, partial [Sediminibacterium sp.]